MFPRRNAARLQAHWTHLLQDLTDCTPFLHGVWIIAVMWNHASKNPTYNGNILKQAANSPSYCSKGTLGGIKQNYSMLGSKTMAQYTTPSIQEILSGWLPTVQQIELLSPSPCTPTLPVGSLGHTSGRDCTGRKRFVASISFLKKASLLFD